MATSLGALTAPPLAAVAVHLLGEDATPALRDFAETEQGRVDRSAPFVSAALQHLGSQPTHLVSDNDRAALEAMLAVARRLHESP